MPDLSRISPLCADDDALAARAATGDDVAFEGLIRRYQLPLLRFLIRLTPRRHDAEDALQETFCRLHAHRARYDARWPFRTWAFTVARRVAVDAHRRRSREPHPSSLADADNGHPIARDASGALAAIVDAEDTSSLWSLARRTLSREQVEALWLCHVESMTAREVARVLGRSWVGTKAMLWRAQKTLRAAVEAPEAAEAHQAMTPSALPPPLPLREKAGERGPERRVAKTKPLDARPLPRPLPQREGRKNEARGDVEITRGATP